MGIGDVIDDLTDDLVVVCPVGEPLSSVFVSPAVTPIRHVNEPYSNNPAFRMYEYDFRDYAVLVRPPPHPPRLRLPE